ncbi:MAG: RtcB family protein [Gammaproteobacteria bacterium]|nr:MAG: RtcB family protein [Gammaproteobacteria bacterium]
MRVIPPLCQKDPHHVDHRKLPIKTWSPELDDKTFKQAQNLANLPFTFKHIALMPDTHMGYGMPIGGVLATKGYVVPNAVGVDIGCGMAAVRLPLKEVDRDALKYIMNMIRKTVPMGFKKHYKGRPENKMPKGEQSDYLLDHGIVSKEMNNAKKSLGTLGGGNHFIEIQMGSDGHVWAMVHSGSRNLGLKVADYYNKIAVSENEKFHSCVPKSHELAYLPIESEHGRNYLEEMNYCVEFARLNRKEMMSCVVGAIYTILDLREDHDEIIDVAHNYARMENHYGENVMVHRKGATSAKAGETGIIPGSQGSMSYIVKGKGNTKSFKSCSHGAGRKMGRKEAQRKLDLSDEIENLDDKGIIHSIRTVKDLDEATGAYKDIEEVMDNQGDLVFPIVQLRPLAVLKG